MKIILLTCVFACFALNVVLSASVYSRNGHAVLVPLANEIIPEGIQVELRKEEIPVVVELDPVAIENSIVREDIVVPVETRVVAVPVAIETVPETEAVVRQSVDVNATPVITTTRPNLLQQAQQQINQFIQNGPLSNVFNRQPVATSTNAPTNIQADVAQPAEEVIQEAEETTVRPNLIQQFQSGVLSFQNQISSILNPNAASAAISNAEATVTAAPSPNFIQQIQQVFRPNSDAINAAAPATNPLQGFVNGIQNAGSQITGIFRPQADVPVIAAAEVTPKPVVQSDEVPVVNENVQIVDDKVDADKIKP